MGRRKSVLIGINYTGTKNQLEGCHQDVRNMMAFLQQMGFPGDPASMVVLVDDRDPRGPYYLIGRNMLMAIDWLICEPNCSLFLHYSGYGGFVKDPDGDRASGFDSTIVPVDFRENGQLDSDTLHRHLVSKMAPGCQMHVIFDCCHSGSAIELPYVYLSDQYGNISMSDNIKMGMSLASKAANLIQGGFSMGKMGEAMQLWSGAQNFFKSLQQEQQPHKEGLGEEHFAEDWKSEHKRVFMFSGCRDDQTSADATVQGSHVGAMSWAFLEVMRHNNGQMNYVQVLQQTRSLLKGRYSQIPQLSCGDKFDLNQPIRF